MHYIPHINNSFFYNNFFSDTKAKYFSISYVHFLTNGMIKHVSF